MALDHANKANAEAVKQIKRHASHLLEVETSCQEEARARADIQDQIGISDRKGNVLNGELEESRMLLDTAERARRNAEAEVVDIRESINTLSTANGLLTNSKRNLESDLRGMQQELDDLMLAVKNGEDKARKAITDAGRLADELRTEQEHGLSADKASKSLAAQFNELSHRLDDVETTALKHGKKIIAKLEDRVRSLQEELSVTQFRSHETHKNALKGDRAIKEMQFNADENQKNMEKLSELVEKLQGKIRTYKKQIEDAEEIAALNLAKYRKAQQQLEDAEERSQMAETNINRLRSGRGSSRGPSVGRWN